MNPDKGESNRPPIRVLILGAGGRDFHNFNTCYRHRPSHRVVAFTATQIPYIDHRVYPRDLAGDLYPGGIPIYPERELPRLIREQKIQEVVFSYSDVSHEDLMDQASLVLSEGAHFLLLGPEETMLKSRLPVISVCAVRTGCGKSAITRKIALTLKQKGIRVSVIRHPMAYCGFQPFLRFSGIREIEEGTCTIEEREEFEPLVEMGITVFAGVDYQEVLRAAEQDSQVILWDGGNNDFSFLKPDWEIVLLDALRPGHERGYYPGEVNLRRAQLLLIAKANEGTEASLKTIKNNIALLNPRAKVFAANSMTRLDHPERIEGKRVLVIEDGPTITHGGMSFGAGFSASKGRAKEVIDPRPYAAGSLIEVYRQYPHIGFVLPAMGYSEEQIRDLEETIARTPCDAVVIATPADLRKRFRIDRPVVRGYYDFDVDLSGEINRFLEGRVQIP